MIYTIISVEQFAKNSLAKLVPTEIPEHERYIANVLVIPVDSLFDLKPGTEVVVTISPVPESADTKNDILPFPSIQTYRKV